MLNIDNVNIQGLDIDRVNDDRNKDLILFLAYLSDLSDFNGLTIYMTLKKANIDRYSYYGTRAYLKGGRSRKPFLTFSMIIHLSRFYSFPFDSSKYMHLLKTKEEAQNEQEQREKLKELEKF